MSLIKNSVLAAYAGSIVLGSAAVSTIAIAAPASESGKCEVKVDRTYTDGTYQVWKQQTENGECRCYVQTGKAPQSETIEQSIAALVRDRECDGAPVQAVASLGGPAALAVGGTGAGTVAAGVGVLAAAGAGVAASGGGNDSPGS